MTHNLKMSVPRTKWGSISNNSHDPQLEELNEAKVQLRDMTYNLHVSN